MTDNSNLTINSLNKYFFFFYYYNNIKQKYKNLNYQFFL